LLLAAVAFSRTHVWGSATAASLGEVSAVDNAFQDAVIRIPPGTTVVWRNRGRTLHTVTADNGDWDTGQMNPGAVQRHTFRAQGRYPFYCRFHGAPGGRGMAGVVLVGEVEDRPGPATPVVPPSAPRGRIIRVPELTPTIQAGVTMARPGDLILIAAGVYHEEVVVVTPYVHIRGLDRNRVILDGSRTLSTGIRVLGANGVVVENMTARHYLGDAFLWTGVRGYRGSYLTASNNGEYGFYAFDSTFGQFDHSYASGHPDAGFYVGQCNPCHAVITDVLAEHNATGYLGTNASGHLTITRSVWRYNMAGIVPDSADFERLPPQSDTRIVGNDVYGNHDTRVPARPGRFLPFGNGIVVAGGTENLVEGNRVWDHPNYGILVAPNVDQHLWVAARNQVVRNTVWASGRADVGLAFPGASGNCFAANRHSPGRSTAIEWVYRCGSIPSSMGGGDLSGTFVVLGQLVRAMTDRSPSGDWRDAPVPPPQPSMSDPLTPPKPAWPTAESERTPDRASVAPDFTGEAPNTGAPVGPRGRVAVETIALVLPWLIYAAWIVVAGWDTIRRHSLGTGKKVDWMILILAVPVAGALAYYAFGRSPLSRSLRVGLIIGGPALYAVILRLMWSM
jgi:plastocyanin